VNVDAMVKQEFATKEKSSKKAIEKLNQKYANKEAG
jgi:hypothetical protein